MKRRTGKQGIYAVVTPSIFSAPAADWIASTRLAHDPVASRVGAHVTLMFPRRVEKPLELSRRLAEAAAATRPFEIASDRLERLDDPFNPERRHLVVLSLQERGAALLGALRASIAVEPVDAGFGALHITVARFAEPADADALLRSGLPWQSPVSARIVSIDLVRLDQGIVVEAQYALGQPASSPTRCPTPSSPRRR